MLPSPELKYTTEPDGSTRVDLMAGERSISRLWIVPFTLRIGAATVRMDGIGGVGTEKEFRQRGYSRQVLEAAVERMRQGDGALSMLYGIPDFYPKFGYATAGPDHYIALKGRFDDAVLPSGWRARPFAVEDVPALRRLYEENTARQVGAAVRSPEAAPWAKLAAPEGKGPEECRIVEDPAGQVRGYAWRARWHWYSQMVAGDEPEALVIAEAMADGPAAADAVLAACRIWAAEEGERAEHPVKRVLLASPPEGPVAAAALYQSAEMVRRYQRCGSSMARVLRVGRLLESLMPELEERLQVAGWPFQGTLELQTDLGNATLTITSDGITVASQDHPMRDASFVIREGETRVRVRMPQSALARLALGAFPPDDLLARLPDPPDERTGRLVAVLFPLRHPHMHLPDRY
jgi:hypothetical protein